MRISMPLFAFLFVWLAHPAQSAELTIVVSDSGPSGEVGAPVCLEVDLAKLFGSKADAKRLSLAESGRTIPVQFDNGRLWWLMPPGAKGERTFQLSIKADGPASGPEMRIDKTGEYFDVAQGKAPVLRYNYGSVPVPEGTHKHFAEGESYERGDYISPMFGPSGEEITDDYPADHPHHRGVWWSWPVTRWRDQVADIWAVVGVHARPGDKNPRLAGGPVMAVIEAENLWKWEDTDAIVRENVLIRAFRASESGRYVDVEVCLTGLVEGVAIGGRPERGYGGFAIRARPGEEQRIVRHTDPENSKPRRAWIDYSAVFPGGNGPTGITLLEHPGNPDYPSELQEYSSLNCVMSAFPGAREVALPKDETVMLKYRIWIHSGTTDEETLGQVWAAYSASPQIAIKR
jgi:methane monooxygenase PmoA-like